MNPKDRIDLLQEQPGTNNRGQTTIYGVSIETRTYCSLRQAWHM